MDHINSILTLYLIKVKDTTFRNVFTYNYLINLSRRYFHFKITYMIYFSNSCFSTGNFFYWKMYDMLWVHFKQECLPVGCVPPVSVAVSPVMHASPATHAPCHARPPPWTNTCENNTFANFVCGR